MASFTLTIELGNAEMESPRHIAFALDGVARRLHDWPAESFYDAPRGSIRDDNGNTVGRWEVRDDG